MTSSFDVEKALKDLRVPADWYALREVRESATHRNVRNAKPENTQASFDHGVMVEVMVDGYIGYAATNHLVQESLQQAATRAYAQARSTAKYAVAKFNHREARPANQGHYISPREKDLDRESTAALMDTLIRASERLKVSDKIVNTEASASILAVEQNYVSSSGAQISQSFLLSSMGLEATAKDGSLSQTRSDHGGRGRCYQSGAEFFADPQILDRAQKIGAEAVELLQAEECPNGTMDLVLMPDQMMLQIHESIGHPLELDRILGDERNYAGFSFVRPHDFGQLQYGSKLLNVTFDPTHKGEFASYAFDEAGVAATREFLIQEGRLLRALGSSESQIRASLPGVANFRSSGWQRAPIDRMANINLEPGTSTFAEMIAAVDRGVLMEANRSWSIDDYRNKFQFGCEYGKLIENGKITRTVRNPNYRGVTTPFWNNLAMVGDASTWEVYGTPFCGKGEPQQVIRVGHGSPVCLFRNIEVFGGHS